MLKNARGVLCAPITLSRADELDLPHQVEENTSMLGTPFTITVDKLEGCTTGVSAHDRAETILALADPASTPQTFGRPGHINPCMLRTTACCAVPVIPKPPSTSASWPACTQPVH
jgi:3,4-dihydroxy 2-butanone 4-phosphate synthase/GTP cyclohydrolase II